MTVSSGPGMNTAVATDQFLFKLHLKDVVERLDILELTFLGFVVFVCAKVLYVSLFHFLSKPHYLMVLVDLRMLESVGCPPASQKIVLTKC